MKDLNDSNPKEPGKTDPIDATLVGTQPDHQGGDIGSNDAHAHEHDTDSHASAPRQGDGQDGERVSQQAWGMDSDKADDHPDEDHSRTDDSRDSGNSMHGQPDDGSAMAEDSARTVASASAPAAAPQTGTPGNDVIVGDNGDNTIFGGAGNDVLIGKGGDDVIYGGDGDDAISGGKGDDVLFGDGPNGPDQVQNLIVNGSFEDVSGLSATTFGYVGYGSVPGWTTASPNGEIDIHGDGRGGVLPTDGQYWADLEGTPDNITLGQDIQGVEDGKLYHLSFSAGDRLTDNNTFQVIWNGEVVDVKGAEILDPVNGDMQTYQVTLVGGSGDGSNRLEFAGLGDPNKRGVSIDDVRMSPVTSGDQAGDDVIHAGDGDDLVYGGDGADVISGGAGNDVIYGDDSDTGNAGGGSGSGHGSGGHDDKSGHGSGGQGHGSGNRSAHGSGGSGKDSDPDKTGDAHGHGADKGDDAHAGDTHGGDTSQAGSGKGDDSHDEAAGSHDSAAGSGKTDKDSDPDKNGDTHGHGADKGDDAHGDQHGGQHAGGGNDSGNHMGGDHGGDDGQGGSGGEGSSGGGSGGGSGSGDACSTDHGTGPNGDTITGGAGNDVIYGMSGNDYLSGGQGNDVIYGGSGNDHILGDAGDDTLDGGTGADCIEGGAGNDTITTGDGADVVAAGDDADVIYGSSGDMIDGGAGGNDFDTLVVTDVNNIEYTSADQEDGIVHFNDGTTLQFEEIEKIVPCFTPGTLILTARGERPVETLQVGDKVVTRDNGLQEIRWIGTKALSGRLLLENAHLRPILIRKGALGRNLPERDMMVSPNHRMLIADARTTLFFEEPEVLVAAKHLVDGKGIQQVDSVGVAYIHMMFDQHEVVLADGSWSESFQPGDYSLKGIGDEQRAEIFEIFPELRETTGRRQYTSARRSLRRKEAQLLR